MSGYTPAPWIADGKNVRAGGVGGLFIARVYGIPLEDEKTPGRYDAERAANARLIAAAPELLDALKDMIDLGRAGFIRGEDIAVTRAVNEARAAIVKAEGQP